MNGSFKDIAWQILKEAGRALHSREITKIAIGRGWLKTAGKTPEATMNAQLIVDINTKGEKSRFIKPAASTFAINPKHMPPTPKPDAQREDKKYRISPNVSSGQKGNIAESRIAELITLYGETALSCYKPISDDEGIDLIIKQKGSLKTMYIQVKSRFGNNPDNAFTATAKAASVSDSYSMAIVFCYFDTEHGDLWDYLWFVPAPDFVRMANKLLGGRNYGFVAGRQKKESNKWDGYLIDKRDLANTIIKQINRI